jgi:mannose-6-phosphate isomerase-like protein (cupin superfamily)
MIKIPARPGGRPPHDRHAFAEWFRVLDGELTLADERDETVTCTSTLATGDTIFVPPWTLHRTLTAPTRPCALRSSASRGP